MTILTKLLKRITILNRKSVRNVCKKYSTDNNNNEISKQALDNVLPKLPEHNITEAIVENGDTIATYPYLLINTTKLPVQIWATQKQLLLPAKFPEHIKSSNNFQQEQLFLQLLKIVMTSKELSSTHLLSIINDLPKELINSKYATFAFRTIIAYINNDRMSNDVDKLLIEPMQLMGLEIIINRLSDVGEPDALLETLELLTISSQQIPNIHKWREQILNTIITDIYNSTFHLSQIFKAIDLLSKYSLDVSIYRQKLPLLWFGIANNENLINRTNIIKLFEYFEALNTSRPCLISLIDRNINKYWKTFLVKDILLILQTLRNFKIKNIDRIYIIIAQWFNRNIFSITPFSFQEILKSFLSAKYNDSNVVKAVERYMKARSKIIEDPHLFLQVAIYLTEFRLRNPIILDHMSDVITNNIDLFAPYAIKDILYTFGILYYKPNNEIQFWKTVDDYMFRNFTRISVPDLMYILLSYIYLENYTIKYKPKIFHPEYLNNFCENTPSMIKAREHLFIYDTALTLSNEQYYGPMFSRTNQKHSAMYDKEIIQCLLKMETHFQTLSEKYNMEFQRLVRLPNLPSSKFYIVDILMYERGTIEEPIILEQILQKYPHKFRAILILKPNAITSDNSIIGSEIMRSKHMSQMGLQTVFLNFNICMNENNSFEHKQNYLESIIFI